MKNILTLLFSVGVLFISFGQIPHAFNYQGMARDKNGHPLNNQSIGVKVTILSGSASGITDYQETHEVSTNDLGVFSLEVGSGSVTTGSMEDITWQDSPKYLEIAIDPSGGFNYKVIGTVQLLSVPYAMYAEKAGNDGDNDSENEIQELSIENNLLSIQNGNTVDLSSVNTDEQTLSVENSQLSISNGNSVDLSEIAQGEKEFQELYLEQNILSITGGTLPVDLAKYLDNTDNQELSLSGTQLSIDRGNSIDLSVLSSSEGNPTDELQTLYLTGNLLGISSGNEVTLPSGVWIEDGNLISYDGDVEIDGITTFNNRFTASGSNNYETFSLKEILLPHTGPHEAILRLYNSSQGEYSESNLLFAAGAPDHARAVISGSHDVGAGTYAGKLSMRVRNGDVSYINALDLATSSASFNVPLYINSNLRVTGDLQVDGSSNLTDGDGDPTNELQTLNIEGNFISISDGNEVELPSSEWDVSEADLSYTSGKVTLSPDSGFQQLVLADVFPPGGQNLEVGDDVYLSDIDMPGVLGIYSLAEPIEGAVKLGDDGPFLYGTDHKLGINTDNPSSTLEVAGGVEIGGTLNATGTHNYGAFMFTESSLPLTNPHEAVMRVINSSQDPNSMASILFAAGSPEHARAVISSSHDPDQGVYGGMFSIKLRNGSNTYVDAVEVKTVETTINSYRTTTNDLHVTGDLTVDGSFDLSAFLPPGIIVPFAGVAQNVPEGWLLCDGSEISRTEYYELFTVIGESYGEGDNSTTFNLPDFRGRFLRGTDLAAGNDPDVLNREASAPGGNTGNNVGSLQFSATMLPNTNFTTNTMGIHNHTGSTGAGGNHDHIGTTGFAGGHSHELQDGTGGKFFIGESVDVASSPFKSIVTGGGDVLNISAIGNHQHNFSTNTTGNHTHTISINNNGGHDHEVDGGGDVETRPVNVYVNYIIKY